jgi:hypothetical protein
MNKKGGCTMKKIAKASIITVFLAFMSALVVGTVTAQGGWEKTITLPSGEKVLDMRGEWDALIELAEQLKWTGRKPEQNILLITQDGNTFSAVQQIEMKITPKGTEKFKGVLNKDGFKEVYIYRHKVKSEFIWALCKGEISEHGNKIVFVDEDRVKWTLTRR